MIESMILNIVGAFVQHIGKALVISIPIYLIVLAIKYFFRRKRNISKYRCILEFILLGYIVTVLSVTDTLSIKISDFSGFHISPNFIPLINTIRDLLSYPSVVLEQIFLNIMFFVPLGILITMLYPKNKNIIMATVVIAVTFSTSVEILEYFIGRYMDVDDIIWNTVGALIGSYMCAFVNKLLSINKKKKVTQIQPML